MSRAIALRRPEETSEKVMVAELPPAADWTVEFHDMDAGRSRVPWNPTSGRVETSGLLFLKTIEEKLRMERCPQGGDPAGADLCLAPSLPAAGVLRPTETSGHRGLLVGLAMVAVVGLSVGVALGLWPGRLTEGKASSVGLGVSGQGIMTSGPIAAARPPSGGAHLSSVPPAVAEKDAEAEPQASDRGQQPVQGETDQGNAPTSEVETASAVIPSGDGEDNGRRTSRWERSRRRAEEKAEEKEIAQAEIRRQQEIQSLPSVTDVLKAATPAAASSPAAKAQDPTAPVVAAAPALAAVPAPASLSMATAPAPSTPAAAPSWAPVSPQASAKGATGGDTYQMLRVAAAQPSAPVTSAAALPRQLSAQVLYGRAQAVRQAARTCLQTFGLTHEVLSLRLEIEGATGRVARAALAGRFADAPVARCVRRAVQPITFPRFTDARQTFVVPISGR